mmetsp:Transcript_4271/g.15964  ORF Transcript_4271/g.15964 Transcript_4271/m.15964 type:complete len:275 (+) Transcript_4271:360-1184(+)
MRGQTSAHDETLAKCTQPPLCWLCQCRWRASADVWREQLQAPLEMGFVSCWPFLGERVNILLRQFPQDFEAVVPVLDKSLVQPLFQGRHQHGPGALWHLSPQHRQPPRKVLGMPFLHGQPLDENRDLLLGGDLVVVVELRWWLRHAGHRSCRQRRDLEVLPAPLQQCDGSCGPGQASRRGRLAGVPQDLRHVVAGTLLERVLQLLALRGTQCVDEALPQRHARSRLRVGTLSICGTCLCQRLLQQASSHICSIWANGTAIQQTCQHGHLHTRQS